MNRLPVVGFVGLSNKIMLPSFTCTKFLFLMVRGLVDTSLRGEMLAVHESVIPGRPRTSHDSRLATL